VSYERPRLAVQARGGTPSVVLTQPSSESERIMLQMPDVLEGKGYQVLQPGPNTLARMVSLIFQMRAIVIATGRSNNTKTASTPRRVASMKKICNG